MPLTATQAPAPRVTYRAVLGTPHVARLLFGTLTGRMPQGMAPVALVLWATATGYGLAFGGLLSALYGISFALSQPLKGRLMDLYGQRTVHLPAAALNSASLLLLPLIGPIATTKQIMATVVMAGLTAPALEAGLRALWPSVLPDPRRRHVALALDTGSQGLLYITGPLLVATLTTLHSPALALMVTAALGMAGTIIVTTSPPSRHWQRTQPDPTVESPARLLGAGFALLCLSLAGVGFAIGTLNVLGVAMAERHQAEMLSGALPAAFAAGTFLGGLAYGARTWPGTHTGQLIAGTAAFTASWLPLLLLPGPSAATAAVMLPGVFLTVIVTSSYLTCDALTPPGRTSEAYTWLLLAIGAGQAAGATAAGHYANTPLTGAALPTAGAALALTTLALARARLAFAQHPTAFPPPPIGDPPCPNHQQSRS
ncbi:MFS transporter [Streptomyces sp. DSM 42041]|uniref:MFS transporter n=1 Tax=Streptomyces hazeniae TaxID=3075538 RepID=A0ABU2P0F9_9ACTN|nr:MFS transporter [Streptomyces sp. DSM 42041]MDT0382326.1 MFS transporter [Streptomyces sp. DSM 42041]